MRPFYTKLLISAVALTPLLAFCEVKSDKEDLLQQGIQLQKTGEWEKALQLWLSAKTELQKRGESDPRIGIAFIELVADKADEKYFEAATTLYFWGLSNANFDDDFEPLQAEVKRVLPLLPADRQQVWQDLLKDRNPAVIQELMQFWAERDPIPSTATNERLIEHWRRIAHARRHFNKSSGTVYNTDDRGLIYVKYGPPDQSRKVVLGNNVTELMEWAKLAQFEQATFRFRQERQNYINLRNAMNAYLTYPECEVWVYASLQTEEPLVFLFGPDDGTGSFGLRDGVEDLIPNTAFTRASSRATGGLMPGSLLQLMYYGKLSPLDPSFEDRYAELESIWSRAYLYAERASLLGQHSLIHTYVNNQFRKELKGRRTEFYMEDTINPRRKRAVASRSNFDGTIDDIDFTAYAVRTLDESNGPQLTFIGFEFERVFRTGQSFTFPSYEFRHQLIIRDQEMSPVKTLVATPVDSFSNTVIYRTPHDPTYRYYTAALETFLNDPQLPAQRRRQPLRVGYDHLALSPPLNPNPNQLELSDIVLGIDTPNADYLDRLPFPLVPSRRITRSDTLKVYLEVYHLARDAGKGNYSIDFRVSRLKKTDDGFQRQEMISTTFEFEAASATSKEMFGIDISNLQAGNYELAVEVSDRVSGQSKHRGQPFQIVEPDIN